MKVSETWLREWINPSVSTTELAHQLTMVGLEIEGTFPAAPAFNGVVIGQVQSVKPHPDAEKLWVCEINIGSKKLLTIITAAENAKPNAKVAVATVGAKLPNDREITAAERRGVVSEGMLCSAEDLGLAEASTELLILSDDAPIGSDLRQWLQLNDQVLEINLTPNRGDCLSVLGVAREIAGIYHLPIPEIKKTQSQLESNVKPTIEVIAKQNCPRYIGRIITDINSKATTPVLIQERLRRSGIRCIHPVVDVVNYVMLELGQPMHAFDYQKLKGTVKIRMANAGESLELLDGRNVELLTETLLIADDSGPQAIAGVMGGLKSAVSETTTTILLESAFFTPLTIAGKARRYGLVTDASQRFERGVDPELAMIACERATELLLSIVGGKAGPIVEIKQEQELPKPVTIKLRAQRIKQILGIDIPLEKINAILQGLGMSHQYSDGIWTVKTPSFRFDIHTEIDLIEEVARIYGYQQIPEQTPILKATINPVNEREISKTRVRQLLVDLGYQEAITYSFVSKTMQTMLQPDLEPLALVNPISAEMAVMRTNLWPGLLTAMQFNLNRQQNRIRLFEIGMRYLPQASGPIRQQMVLSAVITGLAFPEQWGLQKRNVDFFDMKGNVEALFALSKSAITFKPAVHPALHPGQSAEIWRDNSKVGVIGALHPALQQALDIAEPVIMFEIDWSAIGQSVLPEFKMVSKYPSIRRDIAFIINKNITFAEIETIVRQVAGNLLKNLQLFDVYQGGKMEADQRSLALGLILQHANKTLIDDEVNQVIQDVIKALQTNFKVILRD